MKSLISFLGVVPAAAAVTLITAIPISAQDAKVVQPTAIEQGNVPGAAMCGKREEIVQSLSQQFKEAPQAVGVVDQNAVLEIFVSPAGTWTILATGTDGNSCLVSSGEGWDSKTMVAGFDA